MIAGDGAGLCPATAKNNKDEAKKLKNGGVWM